MLPHDGENHDILLLGKHERCKKQHGFWGMLVWEEGKWWKSECQNFFRILKKHSRLSFLFTQIILYPLLKHSFVNLFKTRVFYTFIFSSFLCLCVVSSSDDKMVFWFPENEVKNKSNISFSPIEVEFDPIYNYINSVVLVLPCFRMSNILLCSGKYKTSQTYFRVLFNIN